MELSTNSSGYKVREIQQFLASLGYDLGEGGVDGEYGADTREAVRKFQFKNALRADGIVGPSTLRIMGSKGLPLLPWRESNLTGIFIKRLESFVESVIERLEIIEEKRCFEYSKDSYNNEEILKVQYSTKGEIGKQEYSDYSFRPFVIAEISKMHKDITSAEVIDYGNVYVHAKKDLGRNGVTKVLMEIQEEVEKEFGFCE